MSYADYSAVANGTSLCGWWLIAQTARSRWSQKFSVGFMSGQFASQGSTVNSFWCSSNHPTTLQILLLPRITLFRTFLYIYQLPKGLLKPNFGIPHFGIPENQSRKRFGPHFIKNFFLLTKKSYILVPCRGILCCGPYIIAYVYDWFRT